MSGAAEADAVLAGLPRDWQGWTTRGLNRSPLASRLLLERGGGRAARDGGGTTG
jgi:hypothetical protein